MIFMGPNRSEPFSYPESSESAKVVVFNLATSGGELCRQSLIADSIDLIVGRLGDGAVFCYFL